MAPNQSNNLPIVKNWTRIIQFEGVVSYLYKTQAFEINGSMHWRLLVMTTFRRVSLLISKRSTNRSWTNTMCPSKRWYFILAFCLICDVGKEVCLLPLHREHLVKRKPMLLFKYWICSRIIRKRIILNENHRFSDMNYVDGWCSLSCVVLSEVWIRDLNQIVLRSIRDVWCSFIVIIGVNEMIVATIKGHSCSDGNVQPITPLESAVVDQYLHGAFFFHVV